MPKAPKPKKGSASTSKPTRSGNTRGKDPNQSHLYTDDNPSSTIHGTGFATADAAHHTFDLIKNRSLTYQFQTINTMFHRAKHHPHPTPAMDSAIQIFKEWLEVTYPAAKEARRDFKPLLSKKAVEQYSPQLKKAGIDTTFAETYVSLAPRKRLANVLVDPHKPQEPDWERERADTLSKLVPVGQTYSADGKDLWDGDSLSRKHLTLISWAWSPVPERRLP